MELKISTRGELDSKQKYLNSVESESYGSPHRLPLSMLGIDPRALKITDRQSQVLQRALSLTLGLWLLHHLTHPKFNLKSYK